MRTEYCDSCDTKFDSEEIAFCSECQAHLCRKCWGGDSERCGECLEEEANQEEGAE